MKKIICAILSVCLILTSFSFVYAKDTSNVPTTAELEEVIKQVRTKIDIPSEFSQFDWNYSTPSYYRQGSWNLSWFDPDRNIGRANVTCLSNGEITGFNISYYNEERFATLPEKAPEEYLDKVTAFINKALPFTNGHLELSNVTAGYIYSGSYTYTFTRFENGIIVPDNAVSVQYNYIKDEIVSLSSKFDTGLTFEKPSSDISSEKAIQNISGVQKMVLKYRLKNNYDEKTGKLISRNAFLVYEPELSYVSADAVTGEVYTERNTWVVSDVYFDSAQESVNGALKGEGSVTDSAADRYILTEQELKGLEILNSLITKETAIKKVTENKHLYINDKANAVDAQLIKQNNTYGKINPDESESYIWRLSFSNPSDKEFGYYDTMSADIDAKTGELISFYATLPEYYYYLESDTQIPTIKFTKEDAQKVAESFLSETVSEKYNNTRLSSQSQNSVLEYKLTEDGSKEIPVYRGLNFNFTRVNEGIDFTYNGLYTGVDLVSGKIVSFSQSWYDDVTFESPKNVISPEKALLCLYSSEGFGLNYEINSTYTYNKYLADRESGEYIDYDKLYTRSLNTRLVYSGYALGTTIIRALDGKMIYYSGEEYKAPAKYNYTDIDGHWAQNIINAFSYAGIGFDSYTLFNPDKEITPSEFLKLMESCGMYYGVSDFETDKQTITRAEAVKHIIKALGFESVAKLENVFITDFADNTHLKSCDVGYIAIARGFKIVNGDGNTFRPYDNLTRAEGMQILYNVLKAKVKA